MKNNANKVPQKNRIPKFRLLLFAVTSAYPESLAKARSVGGTVLDQYKPLGEAPAVKGLQEIGLPGLRVTVERVKITTITGATLAE